MNGVILTLKGVQSHSRQRGKNSRPSFSKETVQAVELEWGSLFKRDHSASIWDTVPNSALFRDISAISTFFKTSGVKK